MTFVPCTLGGRKAFSLWIRPAHKKLEERDSIRKQIEGSITARPHQFMSVSSFCNLLIRFLLSERISGMSCRNSFHSPSGEVVECGCLFIITTFWVSLFTPTLPFPSRSPSPSSLSFLLSHRDLRRGLWWTRRLRWRHLPLRGGVDGSGL